jgi:hypothetical protein
MAGLVGRREWYDDVMELCNVLYDHTCDNGFTANLYNAVTMPVGLFPYRQSSTLWRDAASWVCDPDEFREIADDLRAELLDEGWRPPPKT